VVEVDSTTEVELPVVVVFGVALSPPWPSLEQAVATGANNTAMATSSGRAVRREAVDVGTGDILA